MTFPLARHGGVTLVDVGQELSLRSGAALKEAVVERIEKGERQFVLDFADTEFIDSAGLGALISMSKAVQSREGSLKLMRLNDDMRRLFELTKLDTLFDVVDQAEAGVDDTAVPARPPRGPGIERTGQAH
jgi:anti-sigma B factor antagonist